MFTMNPRLAADVFDGEYIIANLDTGLYYSVQGVAVPLLDALPFDEKDSVIRCLGDAMPLHAVTIRTELEDIFQQLLAEDIIREVEGAARETESPIKVPDTYEPPRFNRYADMQDLLMLDPIHDVDEDGWAVQKDA